MKNEHEFDIVKIINNPNTKVTLTCHGPQAVVVTGFLTNDTFQVSGNATYNDLTDESISFQSLTEGGGALAKLAGGAADLAMRGLNISKRPAFTTLAYWENTEKPQFPVDLLFVKYKIGQESTPVNNVKELVSRCYPLGAEQGDNLLSDVYNKALKYSGPLIGGAASAAIGKAAFGDIGGWVAGALGTLGGAVYNDEISASMQGLNSLGFLSAPCNYAPLKGLTERANAQNTGGRMNMDGTWTLEIGKWFCADGLILQNAQFEVSKETDVYGDPIYANGSVQFESSILVTYDKYRSWFI